MLCFRFINVVGLGCLGLAVLSEFGSYIESEVFKNSFGNTNKSSGIFLEFFVKSQKVLRKFQNLRLQVFFGNVSKHFVFKFWEAFEKNFPIPGLVWK